MSNFINRCGRLLQGLEKIGCDGAIVVSQANMYYFSGFTGDSGLLLIAPQGRVLLTDFRYTEQARKQAPDFEVHEFGRDQLYILTGELAGRLGIECAGMEEEILTYRQYNALGEQVRSRLHPADRVMCCCRMVKDQQELKAIERAAAIADQAFDHILPLLPGMSEIEIALELEFFMRRNGAEGLSFPAIVASGPNGSLPHAVPTERIVRPGDLITMDYGCKFQGYCSDMTRTVAIGKVAPELINVYNIVLEAQLAALEEIQSGKLSGEVDKTARRIIDSQGYGSYFGHSLGHGVGIEIHEAPALSPASSQVLQPGMVVTDEPGIYLPGVGGVRIEDLVAVTEDGCRILSHSPKELITL